MNFHNTRVDIVFLPRFCLGGFIILLLIFNLSCASEDRMKVIKTEEGYQFFEKDVPILFYRVKPLTSAEGTHSRANYCHPVLGLDGEVITEDFPKDHLHHRGIFWAWHQVYIGEQLIRDMWDCTDFIWDFHDLDIIGTGENSAALSANVYWKSSQWKNGTKPFVEENVIIRVHRTENNIRIIDFDIRINSLVEDLRIGGSDDDKGYGGFSTRIPLPDDLQISDRNGSVTPDRVAVTAGEWMNFSGTFGDQVSNIAVFIHPSHPGNSRDWILRKKGSCQNVAFPGQKPVSISNDTPLTLKYRVVIHKNADLNKLFAEYGTQ